MDATSTSSRGTAFAHLLALKYCVAGDLESVDLLACLEKWMMAIDWDSPEFIKMCEEMRSPLPTLTEEQEGALLRSIVRGLLHAQIERSAADAEAATTLRSTVQRLVVSTELLKHQTTKAVRNYASLVPFLQQLMDIHRQMEDRLEVLGQDVTSYRIDSIPDVEG